jgi:lycopene cyclase domain-containing protein
MNHYFYLIINAGTILLPLLFSFERKVAFYKQWKYIMPAIVLTAIPFIIFDQVCTSKGIWSFNENYIIGIKIFDLPLEEVLFFFTIPFASLYIYIALNKVFTLSPFFSRGKDQMTMAALALSVFFALLFRDRMYSMIISMMTVLVLFLNIAFKTGYTGAFWRFFLVLMIPFLLVNGMLTGAFFGMDVFRYRPDTISGYRIITIPVEDIFFSMVLMLTNVGLYETIKQSFNKRILYI